MNDVESLLEAQTVALLRRLGREQESRTRHIRDEAATQAADIVRTRAGPKPGRACIRP